MLSGTPAPKFAPAPAPAPRPEAALRFAPEPEVGIALVLGNLPSEFGAEVPDEAARDWAAWISAGSSSRDEGTRWNP